MMLSFAMSFLSLTKGEDYCWWTKVWKLNASLKSRIFLWLVLANKILTQIIYKRNLGKDRVSICCAMNIERLFCIYFRYATFAKSS